VLAPIVPFVTEELWQQVIRPFADDAAESVHHALWPVAPAAWHDDSLLDATRTVRTVISSSLRLREEAKLRVRQPLPALTIVADETARAALLQQQETILAELIVKRVEFAADLSALEEDHLAPARKIWGGQYSDDLLG
jgi:isoleucyl-tRNA synthetase